MFTSGDFIAGRVALIEVCNNMDNNKQQRLDEALASIQHAWGEPALRRLGEITPGRSHLSTGFDRLDEALGIGGIPKGYLTHLSGTPTSGATTLACKLLAQARGEAAVCVDLARTFDTDYAARCGVEVDSLLIIRPNGFDQALEPLSALLEKTAAAVLLLNARSIPHPFDTAALHRLITTLHRSNCPLIVVEPAPTRHLAEAAAVRMHLARSRWLLCRDEVNGFRTRVRILKNPFGRPGQRVDLTIGFSGVVAGDGL